MDEALHSIIGELFWDLEQHFYLRIITMDGSSGPQLTIRDEAMLEEAARLVTMNEAHLQSIIEQANEVEVRRKSWPREEDDVDIFWGQRSDGILFGIGKERRR